MNTDEEKSQLALQASLQSNTQNNIAADNTVTEQVQMAMPMQISLYNYFNPHVQHYHPPFIISGTYTGINYAEHEVTNVHSYGYSQYAQPASTTTNMSAAVDPFGDPEKTRAISSSSNDSNFSSGLQVRIV